jgi:hypothetical protein
MRGSFDSHTREFGRRVGPAREKSPATAIANTAIASIKPTAAFALSQPSNSSASGTIIGGRVCERLCVRVGRAAVAEFLSGQ